MKVLGIIPARGGSKGVPGKNIKHLAGKPLIAYSIDASKDSGLSKLIVSTDDEQIADVARGLGADVPFLRPDFLASDTAKSLDVSRHALLTMEKSDNVQYDAIMLLQPTTPFRTTEDINQAIELLIANPDADSVISVVDVQGHHPARMKYLEEGVLIDPPFCEAYENQNRQELRPMYIRNGAIYLTKRDTLLNNSYKGNKCLGLVMSSARSSNIDTLFDFKLAEWLFQENLLDA
jgi:CMP-N,N'-diacetyllegionaminic acid synthase